MKKLLLLLMIATGILYIQSCSKNAYPSTQNANSSNQLLQGTWRLKTTEGSDTPAIGTTKSTVSSFLLGDIVVVWTATTVEEYLSGKSQGAVPYAISGQSITTKTAQGETRTGQISSLTKDKLSIVWAQNTTLSGSPGASTVICNYVK